MQRGLKFRLLAALLCAATLGVTGCATTPGQVPIDWTPFVRSVDDSISQYVLVKFPEPTAEQALIMSLKAIAVEAAIILMQRNGAPPELIAEQRAKADAVFIDQPAEVDDVVDGAIEAVGDQ